MSKQVIAQCTPSMGMVSIWWSRCMQCVLQPNNSGRSIFYLRDRVGNEIAEVRNALVQQVLEYDARVGQISHVFWVDDDVLVFPGCLRSLIARDKDIVSGVYFTKLPDHLSSPLVYSERCGGSDRFKPDAFYPVWGHGMGLTLVKLDVYKRMRDELLTKGDQRLVDGYGHPQWYHTTKDEDIVVQEDGVTDTGHTEDLHFLDNAAKLGYQPYVDCTKHAFGWHYDSRVDQGYPTEQWKQWIAGDKITWNTPNGDVVWD